MSPRPTPYLNSRDKLEPEVASIFTDDPTLGSIVSHAISAKREADATNKMAAALEEFLAWTKQRWDR